MMEAIELCSGGPRLSPLVQGYWRLADWGLNPQQRLRFIEQHLDAGISSVDHADIYGDYRSESLFGEALALNPGLRERLQIVGKCGIQLMSERFPERLVKHYDASAAHIQASVESSLQALGTDRLDLLLLHRPDPLVDADAVAEVFSRLHADGKVVHFGVSNHTPAQFDLLQSRLDAPLVTNQVEINPLHPNVLFDGALEHAQQHRYRPMAWSPLAGGRVFSGDDDGAHLLRSELNAVSAETGHSPAALLLAWARRLPSRPLVIIGSGKAERVREAVDSLAIDMDRETWFRILAAGRGVDVA
jgi:predicted oxidoreductase